MKEELESALSGTVEVSTGPQADGPTREYELPPVTVTTRSATVTGLGDVEVYEVAMDIDTSTYRFLNDPDNPEQVSPGEAVYQAMDEVGILRPNATPDLGVQVGPSSDGDKDETTVVVQGYVPMETDGGVVSPIVIDTGMSLAGFLALGGIGMARQLVDIGEEYTVKNSLDGVTLDVGLYDDASAGATGDAVSDTDDLAALTSEPSTGNYARQAETFSAADLSGNWGTDMDTDAVFDVTNTTGTVDSWFVEINFASTDAGTTSDHLLCTGALSQEYDLSNLTQLTVTAGGVGWSIN